MPNKADPDPVAQEHLLDLQQDVTATAQPGHLRSRRLKKKTRIRLSPEVLEAFRATGPDWQERMDAALRTALEDGWLESVEE